MGVRMKCLFGLLLAICISTCCQADYVADLTLKKPWTMALEDTQPAAAPYAALFDLGKQKLTYVAISPANQAKSTALIESLIQSEKPQVILVQGLVGDNVPHAKVKFKVGDAKTAVNGISCDRETVLRLISLYGVTEKDYECFKVVELMSQVWQFQEKGPNAVKAKAASYLSSDPHAKKLQLTFQDVQAWFREKMGKPFTDAVIKDCDLVAPKDPKLASTNYLQKVSSYEDEVQDGYALAALGKALDQNQRVMFIRAASKYVMERDVLFKMLEVKAPSRIVSQPK